MKRNFIGNSFYELMMSDYNSEEYTLTQLNGKKWTGKISLAVQRYSKVLEEKEYLLQGAATFPNIEAQESFRGCYFKRSTDHMNTYILTAIIPEPTDERIGYIYCVECNETVTLANLEKQIDEKGDSITTPVPFAEDVKVYFDTTLKKQQSSSDGNFDATSYYMQMPAHYGISEDQVVLRKSFVWDKELKKNLLNYKRYRVESVTLSTSRVGTNGEIYGIVDVQMSVDTRG